MLPVQPLRTRRVTISHEFRPAAEVGGDYLDYFQLSDETMGLYIGDLSGKGLPAALYAALAVGTLRGVHKTGRDPKGVLSLLNRIMRTELLCAVPACHAAACGSCAVGNAHRKCRHARPLPYPRR
jgi:sigma-B regulation protein RsbU (phosphoserine phosphatase)